MSFPGFDAGGELQYNDPQQLWQDAERGENGINGWYSKAIEYWDQQDPSYDGVLGGFGCVSDADIKDSLAFLKKAYGKRLDEAAAKKETLVAVDCGAGVGRVSEQLLLHHFHEVDLVEPSAHLLEEGRKKLSANAGKLFPSAHRAVHFFQMGLQDFTPQPGRYDVVWIQWALLYLTDVDAISFFRRCCDGLKPGGVMFVKENICKEGFIVDKEDSSLTRSHEYMLDLFAKSGLRLMFSSMQRNFPKNLFKVRMYALQPAKQQ